MNKTFRYKIMNGTYPKHSGMVLKDYVDCGIYDQDNNRHFWLDAIDKTQLVDAMERIVYIINTTVAIYKKWPEKWNEHFHRGHRSFFIRFQRFNAQPAYDVQSVVMYDVNERMILLHSAQTTEELMSHITGIKNCLVDALLITNEQLEYAKDNAIQ